MLNIMLIGTVHMGKRSRVGQEFDSGPVSAKLFDNVMTEATKASSSLIRACRLSEV